VLSNKFKTAAHFSAQPVTLTLLMQVYIKYFRVACDGNIYVFTTTVGTSIRQGYINRGKCMNVDAVFMF